MSSKTRGKNRKECLGVGRNPCHHCWHVPRAGSEDAEVIGLRDGIEFDGAKGEIEGGESEVNLGSLPGRMEGEQFGLGRNIGDVAGFS